MACTFVFSHIVPVTNASFAHARIRLHVTLKNTITRGNKSLEISAKPLFGNSSLSEDETLTFYSLTLLEAEQNASETHFTWHNFCNPATMNYEQFTRFIIDRIDNMTQWINTTETTMGCLSEDRQSIRFDLPLTSIDGVAITQKITLYKVKDHYSSETLQALKNQLIFKQMDTMSTEAINAINIAKKIENIKLEIADEKLKEKQEHTERLKIDIANERLREERIERLKIDIANKKKEHVAIPPKFVDEVKTEQPSRVPYYQQFVPMPYGPMPTFVPFMPLLSGPIGNVGPSGTPVYASFDPHSENTSTRDPQHVVLVKTPLHTPDGQTFTGFNITYEKKQ